MVDTLIFDFDGVIIDTESVEYATWQEIYNDFNVSMDIEQWEGIIGGGVKWFDPIENLERLVGPIDDKIAIIERRRKRLYEIIDSTPLLPGVESYIHDAKEMGLKVGLASSSTSEWVERHLKDRGLLPYFEAMATRDEVSLVKPDPELYLKVVRKLNSNPTQTLAIEDSVNGLEAAKAAGLLCAVVPNPMTEDMDFQKADLILGSLENLSLKKLLTTITPY